MRSAVLAWTALGLAAAVSPAGRAVWADEVDPAGLPAVWAGKEAEGQTVNSGRLELVRQRGAQPANLSRQLEAIAFPVGIAIGAIGAAILPSLFPSGNTSSTATGTGSAGDNTNIDAGGAAGDLEIVVENEELSTSTVSTTTTTFTPRTLLEDFDMCGVKGSSKRVVGGTEVVENEVSYKYVTCLC